MPEPLSRLAGVYYLDGEAAIAHLKEAAWPLLDSRSDVLAVHLFGSLAQGRHVPGSDADLLIILARDSRRMVDRVPEFLRAFLSAPLPVDVFPLTRQEIEERQGDGDPFVRQALDRGILLAGRM